MYRIYVQYIYMHQWQSFSVAEIKLLLLLTDIVMWLLWPCVFLVYMNLNVWLQYLLVYAYMGQSAIYDTKKDGGMYI